MRRIRVVLAVTAFVLLANGIFVWMALHQRENGIRSSIISDEELPVPLPSSPAPAHFKVKEASPRKDVNQIVAKTPSSKEKVEMRQEDPKSGESMGAKQLTEITFSADAERKHGNIQSPTGPVPLSSSTLREDSSSSSAPLIITTQPKSESVVLTKAVAIIPKTSPSVPKKKPTYSLPDEDLLSYEIPYQGDFPSLPEHMTDQEIHDATIYIAIPTYRDPECPLTIDDIFANAANPDRIFIGIAQYNVPTEDDAIDCARACTVCQERAPQIQIKRLLHTQGAGPATSRGQSVMMYRGEQFYMQIDSHCVFTRGWDTEAIRQLYATGSRKPFLTVYPLPYTVTKDGDVAAGIARVVKDPFEEFSGKMAYICGGVIRKQGDFDLISEGDSAIVELTDRPLQTTHYAGGFSFSAASALREVAFDPLIRYLFGPDESLRAARLWTHGWDLFAPNSSFIAHHYDRPKRPKFWNSKKQLDWMDDLIRSARRAEFILHRRTRDQIDDSLALVDVEKFGLGSERSLGSWEAFIGVDWSAPSYKHCEQYYDDETSSWRPISEVTPEKESAADGEAESAQHLQEIGDGLDLGTDLGEAEAEEVVQKKKKRKGKKKKKKKKKAKTAAVVEEPEE